ncbi:unnamed protein product (macronuclear) [Paramecium tetraurelia]|uniref:WD40-repeat-containing domain n=1 Tax=Paramecium tetraurelia TaxID=5888 RepID=A0C698_PARTE|nr:uncharacterized protein GSPATT00035444001 [Paramecium tetraurelia]CAK66315.1 unnamed protein product [Paramecium tetraurelia]|eukprot:XP_001433712.1 hypothetical protein (macronuclear) [Paramecium tetraurelia strain d4-2]
MQHSQWVCPFHLGNVIKYVSIKPNIDPQEILLCKACVSERFGGSLENLKQLSDVLEELRQNGNQSKNVLEFKEKQNQEFRRIEGKLNGIFESRPYLSIQIGQNSSLSDLRQVISNSSQNKSKEAESIKKEINLWQKESEKFFLNLCNDIKALNRQIEQEYRNIDISISEYEMMGEIQYHQMFQVFFIEPNWEDNYLLIVEKQSIDMITLENDKIKQQKIIESETKANITCAIEDKDPSRFFVGYHDGSFQVWEKNFDGKYRSFYQQKDHGSSILSIILCKKHNLLITQSKEHIHFWYYDGKSLGKRNMFPYQNEQMSIAYLSVNLNDSLLAAVVNGQTIAIFQLDQWQQQIQPLNNRIDQEIVDICFMKNDGLAVFLKDSKFFLIYKLNFQNQIQLALLEKLDLRPKFYQDIGVLQVQSEQELLFFEEDQNKKVIEKQRKQNDEQETIIEKIKRKKQMVRYYNFGQNSLYLSPEFEGTSLKVAKIKYLK